MKESVNTRPSDTSRGVEVMSSLHRMYHREWDRNIRAFTHRIDSLFRVTFHAGKNNREIERSFIPRLEMKSFPYENVTDSNVSLDNSKTPIYQSNGRFVQKAKFKCQ